VPAMFGVGVAPDEEPRSGSSSSARESTSGRSTNYGRGHLIRVFHDIGRIFSLLFLLSHPSPIGHLLRSSVQSRSRNMVSSEAKNGFNSVSWGTFQGGEAARHPPNENPARARSNERGLGNPHGVGGRKGYVTRAPLRKLTGAPGGSRISIHLHEACQQAWADKQEQPRRARADRSR
jgi:hypothetical protein